MENNPTNTQAGRTSVAAQLPSSPTNEISLRDIYLLSISHWWWYVLSVAVCMAFGMLYLLRTPKVYTRTASVQVKEEGRGSSSLTSQLSGASELGLFSESSNVYNEQLNLRMPAVVLETIKRLHLDWNYSVPGTFHSTVLYGQTLPIAATIEDLPDNDGLSFKLEITSEGKYTLSDFQYKNMGTAPLSGIVGQPLDTPAGKLLISKSAAWKGTEPMTINVSRSGLYGLQDAIRSKLTSEVSNKQATIIDMTYTDVNTQRAEEILNTVIAVSNENWVKDKNQVAVSTSEFINERLKVIEQELGNVDNSISDYKSSNLITDNEAAAQLYMQQNVEGANSLMELNNQLYMVRYLKNQLQNGNSHELLPQNSGIGNAAIESQLVEYNTQILQRNNLISSSSEKNPLVQDLDKTLAGMRQNILRDLDNEQTELSQVIRSQQGNMGTNTHKLANAPGQQKYLLSVERQQKVKESLYLYLLQKREENELSQAFTAYNTRVVNPPMGSPWPTSPNSQRILLIALAIGVCIPLGLLYLKEMINTKVRGRKDIEKLSAPYAGEIPMYDHHKGQRLKGLQVVVKPKSNSIINEAFRVVRTNLEFMSINKKVIMVTSCNPGSGKSFLSVNLAAAFGIRNKKVCVLDLDLRCASARELVGRPTPGVSNYLAGMIDEITPYDVPEHPNIKVIPVGTIPPNPTELLLSDRLKTLIEQLRQQYDYVFIDCPPVEIVADANIIAPLADMTLFVIRAELLEREMLPVIERYYTEKKYNNLTLLLNGTTTAHGRYGYHYGYSRYGYTSHYGAK